MKRLEILLLFNILISCKESPYQNSNPDTVKTIGQKAANHTLDYGKLSIVVPVNWQKANDDTVPKLLDATNHYRILLPNRQLVYILYGLSIWDISEEYKNVHIKPCKISGFKGKRFRTKTNELNGAFIDSVGVFHPTIGNYGFLIYGENLDPIYSQDLESAIFSIRLKKFK
jgi:hypothetical protein